MLFKTRGLVLHHVNYSESSIIAYLYTEKFGRQAYLIHGAKNKKSLIRSNLFQPLFLLDMEVYHKQNRNLQKIKEAKNNPVFLSIPYSEHKRSIAFFLSEVLYKVLKEEESNPSLFEFLHSKIHFFDLLEENYNSFHLDFLVNLSKHLGFYPRNNYSNENCYFDLMNGIFINRKPIHNHYFGSELAEILHAILSNRFHSAKHGPAINNQAKTAFLVRIMEYYQLHLEGLGQIKSLDVLKEIYH